MRIAFIYDAAYPWNKGGAEKRVYELAWRLAKKGHEVHWYTFGWWWEEYGQRDIKFQGINMHGVHPPMDLYSKNRRSIRQAIYFALKLFPRLNEERFDVVDCQGFPFFSAFTAKYHALRGRSKLVLTIHEAWDDYWYEYLGWKGFFGKLIEKIMLKLTPLVIAVSPKTCRDIKHIRSALEPEVIPNGINFKQIIEIEAAMQRSDIIFAGRLIKEKNLTQLLESLKIIKEQIPDISCKIIGEGPEKIQLQQLVQEYGLQRNVEFIGFLDDASLISYIKASKVFVLPSLREGFGMVVLEANACGLPVVVIENPMNAAVDLITSGVNGFVSKPDKENLALNIIKALNKGHKMRESCREHAQEYNWDFITNKLEKYYQKIL